MYTNNPMRKKSNKNIITSNCNNSCENKKTRKKELGIAKSQKKTKKLDDPEEKKNKKHVCVLSLFDVSSALTRVRQRP